ncbi:MAG: hypothetical protein LBS20_11775 [Prevotella sp.]|jgi:hypothetical protein|nr:hypothetical protein [Prevotella sp.]
MDLPASGYSIRILLQVRRFSCKNTQCRKKIFLEQYPGYVLPYAGRTLATTVYLQKILLEISARKGAYITDAIHLPVSASTCLRVVGSLNIPIQEGVDAVGIDDWASRKGMTYGTILVTDTLSICWPPGTMPMSANGCQDIRRSNTLPGTQG